MGKKITCLLHHWRRVDATRWSLDHRVHRTRLALCKRGMIAEMRIERGYYFIADDGCVCGLCVGMTVRC